MALPSRGSFVSVTPYCELGDDTAHLRFRQSHGRSDLTYEGLFAVGDAAVCDGNHHGPFDYRLPVMLVQLSQVRPDLGPAVEGNAP